MQGLLATRPKISDSSISILKIRFYRGGSDDFGPGSQYPPDSLQGPMIQSLGEGLHRRPNHGVYLNFFRVYLFNGPGQGFDLGRLII